jgi:hypothetical protein
MHVVLNSALPVFALILTGFICGRFGVFDRAATDVLVSAGVAPFDARPERAALLRQPRLPDVGRLDDVVVDADDLGELVAEGRHVELLHRCCESVEADLAQGDSPPERSEVGGCRLQRPDPPIMRRPAHRLLSRRTNGRGGRRHRCSVLRKVCHCHGLVLS